MLGLRYAPVNVGAAKTLGSPDFACKENFIKTFLAMQLAAQHVLAYSKVLIGAPNRQRQMIVRCETTGPPESCVSIGQHGSADHSGPVQTLR